MDLDRKPELRSAAVGFKGPEKLFSLLTLNNGILHDITIFCQTTVFGYFTLEISVYQIFSLCPSHWLEVGRAQLGKGDVTYMCAPIKI